MAAPFAESRHGRPEAQPGGGQERGCSMPPPGGADRIGEDLLHVGAEASAERLGIREQAKPVEQERHSRSKTDAASIWLVIL